jgi:hypothetical protein
MSAHPKNLAMCGQNTFSLNHCCENLATSLECEYEPRKTEELLHRNYTCHTWGWIFLIHEHQVFEKRKKQKMFTKRIAPILNESNDSISMPCMICSRPFIVRPLLLSEICLKFQYSLKKLQPWVNRNEQPKEVTICCQKKWLHYQAHN